MDQLTEEQAIELAQSGAWEDMTVRERAEFQIVQDRLCMPFAIFHEAVEEVVGRPVQSIEFGINRDGLREEIFNGGSPLSFDDLIDRVIELREGDKSIIVVESPRGFMNQIAMGGN